MKPTKLLLLTSLVFTSVVNISHASTELRSKMYEMKSNRQKLLFNSVETTDTERGIVKSKKTIFTDPAGKEVAFQETSYDEHGRLVQFVTQWNEMHKKASVKIVNNKAIFTLIENGNESTDEENFVENFVVTSTLLPFLKSNWTKILNGEEVSVRLAAVERKETVGFKLYKSDEKKLRGRDVIIVTMKPTSWFIAKLVDPLLFTIDKKTVEVYEGVGRITPKVLTNGKWKDVEAEIVYY